MPDVGRLPESHHRAREEKFVRREPAAGTVNPLLDGQEQHDGRPLDLDRHGCGSPLPRSWWGNDRPTRPVEAVELEEKCNQ